MNRLPKDLYDQLKIKDRQPLTRCLKPIFDKGQVIIRLPTAFNPELDITEDDRIEVTLIANDPPEIYLRKKEVDDVE
jgi:hypothetical protein